MTDRTVRSLYELSNYGALETCPKGKLIFSEGGLEMFRTRECSKYRDESTVEKSVKD